MTPEERRAYTAQWRRNNPEKVRAHRDRENAKRKEQSRNRDPRYWYSIKLDVLAAYGGFCVCCGESNPVFLCLDHINNDGAEHRKRKGSGFGVYQDLRSRGYPPEVQVLCHNCNQGKKSNGGIECPHKLDLFRVH